MIKYISIFRLVLRCLLVARKENSTDFSTGLTGRSKNLDPTGNPTCRSTRPVSISATNCWGTSYFECFLSNVTTVCVFNENNGRVAFIGIVIHSHFVQTGLTFRFPNREASSEQLAVLPLQLQKDK